MKDENEVSETFEESTNEVETMKNRTVGCLRSDNDSNMVPGSSKTTYFPEKVHQTTVPKILQQKRNC